MAITMWSCLLVKGGRYDLTPERVGINIDDARIPDNKGNRPIDVAIQEDGAPAYFSNLPVKTMTEAIKARRPCKLIEYEAHLFVTMSYTN